MSLIFNNNEVKALSYNNNEVKNMNYDNVPVYKKYTELAYIQGTGSQYIDTGVKPNQDTIMEFDIKPSNANSGYTRLFGAGTYSSAAFDLVRYDTSTQYIYRAGGSNVNVNNINISNNVRHKLKIGAGERWLDGVLVDTYNTTFTTSSNLCIPEVSYQGIRDGIIIYGIKIWQGNELIKDLIPVLDDNNVACMYDKINQTYIYNAGSGSFSYGNKQQPMELEYIQGTGTQYIDTAYKPNNNTKVIAKMKIPNVQNIATLFAGRNAYQNNEFVYLFNNTSSQLSVQIGNIGFINYSLSKSYFGNTSFTITAQNGNVELQQDNSTKETISTTSVGSFQTNYNMFIGAINTSNTVEYINSSYYIYTFKIYENDTLVRDFIPMTDEAGEACLYDKVTERYYYNQGTGKFTPAYKPYQTFDFIRSTGTQYIDTGFKPNQDTRVVMNVITDTASCYWFGCWNIAYNNGAYALGNDGNGIYSGYDGQGGTTGLVVLGELKLDFNKNNIYINDNLFNSFIYTNFQVNYNLILFGQNRAGSTFGIATYILKDCKIYDNNILVRDLIPKSDNNGTVCLYDNVSETYFYNQGTGSFIAGNEV